MLRRKVNRGITPSFLALLPGRIEGSVRLTWMRIIEIMTPQLYATRTGAVMANPTAVAWRLQGGTPYCILGRPAVTELVPKWSSMSGCVGRWGDEGCELARFFHSWGDMPRMN